MNELNYEGTRKDFKLEFFKYVLFSKQMYSNQLSDYFKKEFPTVYSILYKEKSGGDKSKLPVMLQKIESEYIFTVVRRLLGGKRKNIRNNVTNRLENMYLLTIHDSILTTSDKSEKVKYVMEEVFYEMFNDKVKIEIEFYG
jgi:hypothetical protein